MYPGSLAAETQRKVYGRRMRVTEIALREVVSRDHADGRNIYSETDKSRKKNIYISLVYGLSRERSNGKMVSELCVKVPLLKIKYWELKQQRHCQVRQNP